MTHPNHTDIERAIQDLAERGIPLEAVLEEITRRQNLATQEDLVQRLTANRNRLEAANEAADAAITDRHALWVEARTLGLSNVAISKISGVNSSRVAQVIGIPRSPR